MIKHSTRPKERQKEFHLVLEVILNHNSVFPTSTPELWWIAEAFPKPISRLRVMLIQILVSYLNNTEVMSISG